MRSAPAEVIALLNSGRPYVFADCFTITLTNGTILRYTNAQRTVKIIPPGEVGYENFLANSILIDGMKMNSKRGLDVDEQDCSIFANVGMEVNGQPWMKALRIGFLDGATVRRDRAYAYTWGNPQIWEGAVTLFQGFVSTCDPIGGQKAMMKVKSSLIVLDQDMPRNYFQTGCMHTLYDSGCGLDKDSFAEIGLVESGSTAVLINWAGASPSTFDLGTITMETGPNTGISRSIRKSNAGSLELVFPFESTPLVGDQFKAYPGCDLTKTTCETKFANLNNFRGFPFVPPTATSY
jgi:uncharacterized phage protein (TIGR02218 family)